MPKMLQDVVVIAKHGTDYIDKCLKSFAGIPYVVVDTGTRHPTGAYLEAFRSVFAENYLFVQDSMENLSKDPIQPFKDKMPEMGAVGWMSFPYVYDDEEQMDWVESQYNEQPGFGIFGPIFYTSRQSLQFLNDKNLLPKAPNNRIQAQGTERSWACAFHAADLPVEFLYAFNPGHATDGTYLPFIKTFGNRK